MCAITIIAMLFMILISVITQGSSYMNVQGTSNQTNNQTTELSEIEEGEEIGAEETL
ncbi:MAG: hypothetical protein ACRD8Z_08165 [Nitrososphaeraceae archaeon]